MKDINMAVHGKGRTKHSDGEMLIQVDGQRSSSTLWMGLCLLMILITVSSLSFSIYTVKMTRNEVMDIRTELVALEELCRTESIRMNHGEVHPEEEDDDDDDDYVDDDGEIEPGSSVLSDILQRTRRGLNTTQKAKKAKKDKKKKKKKGRQQKLSAAHFIPEEIDPASMKAVREGETRMADCGELKPLGIQVHCEIGTYWQLDPAFRNNKLLLYANGVAVITKPGLYYIYSQVTHHDVSGSWAYAVVQESSNKTEETLLRCQGTEPHLREEQGKTYAMQFQCHSSRAVYLKRGDQISVRNPYYDHRTRVVKLDKTLSFWGLIWLGK